MGNIIWGSKKYGGSGSEILRDMIACTDGGYAMLGISNSNDGDVGFHYGGQFNDDIWVLKLDSNGNKMWGAVLGGSADEEAYALTNAPNGGMYVVGSTFSTDYDCTSNHGNKDIFVARLDDSGSVLWKRCAGGSNSDGSQGWGCADGKGGLLVATKSYSADGDVHNNWGSADMWVFDIDSSNNVLWDKSYGGSSIDEANCIAKAADGSIWIGGKTYSADGQVDTSYGDGDAWIVHTDSAGNMLSSKVLGESNADAAFMVQPLTGGMVMAGGTYEGAGPAGGEFPSEFWGGTDVFLARLAPWTTGIKDVGKNEQMNICPNPASDIVNLTFSKTDFPGLTLKVFNEMGTLVHVSKFSRREKIDVHNWAKGIYCVQVISENGIPQAQTLLVQ